MSGFYIQEDFWESVEDLDDKAQDAYFGAIARLFFTGEDKPPKPKESKRSYILSRKRVQIARSRSDSANARWDAKVDANDHAKPDAKPNAKADAKPDAKPDANTDAKVDANDHAKPDAKVDRDLQQVIGCKPIKSESEKKSKTKSVSRTHGGGGFTPPSFDEFNEYAISKGMTPSEAETLWWYYDSQGWLKKNGLPLVSWRGAISGAVSRDKAASEKKEANDGSIYANVDW